VALDTSDTGDGCRRRRPGSASLQRRCTSAHAVAVVGLLRWHVGAGFKSFSSPSSARLVDGATVHAEHDASSVASYMLKASA
jgi:hypothetical protein